MNIQKLISEIPDEEKSPLVMQLLAIIALQAEEIQKLKDEIARLKGQKPRPNIKPSRLEKNKKKKKKSKKRAGSKKKEKTKEIKIHDTKVVKADAIPKGSMFKGYNDYTVQDLKFEAFNTLYRIERWEGPNGEYIVGTLPSDIKGHFGCTLKSFILHQYYHGHVTQPLIFEQLNEIGIHISTGEISRIIIEDKGVFHTEKEEILKKGLEVSRYINVDDTGARHDGNNGYCTHIGNELFAYFESTESKSRINFLKILRAGFGDYIVNFDAIVYMEAQKLPKAEIKKILGQVNTVFKNERLWKKNLKELGITNTRHIRIATEGVLIGSIIEHGFNKNMVIISDDAGQFNVLMHALCWIHSERAINKLVGFNKKQRKALEKTRGKIWNLYRDLKDYKISPTKRKKSRILKQFDKIFLGKTCFATLNNVLGRIYNNKDELLLVLDRPEIPLHNNLSESDIREYVKKRKISGSTRSSPGRRCRDTFTSLKKTCRKHGISFWEYLQDRLTGRNLIPFLPDLIDIRAKEIWQH